MPTINRSVSRYNAAGDAKLREQKFSAERIIEEKNKGIKPFMFRSFGFRAKYRVYKPDYYLEGPLCPRLDQKKRPCLSELLYDAENKKLHCDVCGFSLQSELSPEELRNTARRKYEGYLRYIEAGGQIETLDIPYDAIKAHDEDETRTIKIKWSQKDGRNMAVIYFFDKKGEGSKTQLMIDMDREEIRYDASDIPPGKALAVVQAIFPGNATKIDYTKKG